METRTCRVCKQENLPARPTGNLATHPSARFLSDVCPGSYQPGLTNMDPKIRALWIKALRSGRFEQGQGALRYVDREDGQHKHCCWGVLYELAVRDGIIGYADGYAEYSVTVYTDGKSRVPGHVVLNWAGLVTKDGVETPWWINLAHLNDHGTTFAAIADIIEKNG